MYGPDTNFALTDGQTDGWMDKLIPIYPTPFKLRIQVKNNKFLKI